MGTGSRVHEGGSRKWGQDAQGRNLGTGSRRFFQYRQLSTYIKLTEVNPDLCKKILC